MTATTHRVPARDGRPAPRWAVRAAHLVAVCALPSGLWRIGIALGFSLGMLDANGEPLKPGGRESADLISLSAFTEALAFLTLGLVRPFGERIPRWIPRAGGRRIPPLAVIGPAAVGAVALTVLWTAALMPFSGDENPLRARDQAWVDLAVACYLPLLLWGPLLATVTYAYWRRRCRN